MFGSEGCLLEGKKQSRLNLTLIPSFLLLTESGTASLMLLFQLTYLLVPVHTDFQCISSRRQCLFRARSLKKTRLVYTMPKRGGCLPKKRTVVVHILHRTPYSCSNGIVKTIQSSSWWWGIRGRGLECCEMASDRQTATYLMPTLAISSISQRKRAEMSLVTNSSNFVFIFHPAHWNLFSK